MKLPPFVFFRMILMLVFASCFFFTASGQTWIEKSIQIDINSKDYSSYKTLEFPSEGVLILRKGNRRPDKHHVIIGQFYDQNLAVQWTRNISIHRHYRLLTETTYKDKAYLLAQNSKRDFLILQVDIKDGKVKEFALGNIEKVTPTHFEAFENHIVVGGQAQEHPTAIIFDTQLHKKSILPSLHQLQAKLIHISYHPEVHSFTIVSKSTKGLQTGIHFNTYWEDGRLQNNFWLEDTEDYNLQTFRPFLNAEHKLIVLGTYGLKSSKQVQGVYSLNFNEEGAFEDMKFYDFGYFKNFYQSLSEKRRARLAKKIETKRKKGKIYPLRHHFYLYDLKFVEDQVVFVAEEVELNRPARTTYFRPNTYPHTVSPSLALQYTVPLGSYTSSLKNRGVTSTMFYDLGILTEQVFPSEIEYTQLIACGFDKNGKLSWDNAFPLKNSATSIPKKHADIIIQNGKISLLETFHEQIRFVETDLKKYSDSIQTQNLELNTFTGADITHHSTSQWGENQILIISEARKASLHFSLRPQKWLIIRSLTKKDDEQT